jgi:hypothetical protein
MVKCRSRLAVGTIARGRSRHPAVCIVDVAATRAACCREFVSRKQLAMYLERQVKPRRADDATRLTLAALSRLIDWRQLLTVVKPETLIRWHRKGFRLFWRWKSRPHGRPRVPAHLRQLIGEMAEHGEFQDS